jgi:hypothetical protein
MVENHGMRPPTGQTLPPSRTHTHTVTVDAHKLPPTTRPRHVSNRVGATFRCRRGSLQVDSGRGSIAGEYILRYKPRRPCHVSSSVLPTLVYKYRHVLQRTGGIRHRPQACAHRHVRARPIPAHARRAVGWPRWGLRASCEVAACA